jgi:HSP20 family molecular chaperone IbpA
MGNLSNRSEFDDIVGRWFGDNGAGWPSGGFNVPTDVFHTDDRLVIRMELPGVDPDDVDVTIQENVLLINGSRKFPFDADKVRFVRRGTFYGDFTQKVALGKGLNTEGQLRERRPRGHDPVRRGSAAEEDLDRGRLQQGAHELTAHYRLQAPNDGPGSSGPSARSASGRATRGRRPPRARR